MSKTNLDISVVVPLLDEEESLPELCAWIERVMHANKFSYEVIMVDDGSRDKSWQIIEKLAAQNHCLKGIRLNRNYGKSAALNTGFKEVQGQVVITMDADLQDSPDEIPGLYKMIVEDKYDMVSGWKKKRYDPMTKTIPTKVYNAFTRWFSGIKLHDFNCGLKAYDYQVVKSIEVYGEMHRYIPVIAKSAGFKEIGEKVVQHQARKYGNTKFGGIKRFIRGPLDLLSITFVTRFRKRPMHFFGAFGIIFFLVGFASAAWLILDQFIATYFGTKMGSLVTNRPLFYLSLVTIIIGVQLFLAGFLGEMMVVNSPQTHEYIVAEKLGINHSKTIASDITKTDSNT
ncbi:glycosyltransferase family 2 protein [uncultured Microscilla sp.]|uniref:glycosyltransferase family 2 protein n=1 Tax=uncultured Microscilla sp. TaxID=432653 RepID=UPI0026165FB6|nr:glycosyltransferase family 2 protein [uncultured Microscilla sp.]